MLLRGATLRQTKPIERNGSERRTHGGRNYGQKQHYDHIGGPIGKEYSIVHQNNRPHHRILGVWAFLLFTYTLLYTHL